jgi:hypothetical protein
VDLRKPAHTRSRPHLFEPKKWENSLN